MRSLRRPGAAWRRSGQRLDPPLPPRGRKLAQDEFAQARFVRGSMSGVRPDISDGGLPFRDCSGELYPTVPPGLYRNVFFSNFLKQADPVA